TDKVQFADRCTKVSEYYSTIKPFSGRSAYNGPQVSAEATADMGGIRVTLSVASKKKDFDYDKYFRQYAMFWRDASSEDNELIAFGTDEHPLNYLRINVGLQQFDEFYETYGIKEGDGMYLAEDKRISVW
ncbi:MAG: M13 family peptidase, partial [Firmicutes bacterium]|nr:M13 family peptidase [Bacillota bacterium]